MNRRHRAIALLCVTLPWASGCEAAGPPVEGAESSAAVSAAPGESELAAESRRLDAFLEEVFQEELGRSPMRQSSLGFKTDYDRWDDISDVHVREDHEITERNLARLTREFDPRRLDAQADLSYRLFARRCRREIENFPWRFHNYPVNQMSGLHSEVLPRRYRRSP